MKITAHGLLTLAFALLLTSASVAQEKKEEPPAPTGSKPVSEIMSNQLSLSEKNVKSLAEAVPEDKYAFVPTGAEFKTSRSFGGQLKHIATANYLFGSSILGEKMPIETKGPDGPENIKTKAEITKFLNDSYAYLHKALDSITDKNATELIKNPFGSGDPWTRLGVATLGASHGFDHYGQMVIYARLNGIVPPGSRPQQ